MATASQNNHTSSSDSQPLPGDSKAWYWLVWAACFVLLLLARKVEPGHDSGQRISSQEYHKPCELLFAREDRVVFFDRDNGVPHLMSMSESGAVTSYSVPVPEGEAVHPRLVAGDTKSSLVAAVEKNEGVDLLVIWRKEASDVCSTKNFPTAA